MLSDDLERKLSPAELAMLEYRDRYAVLLLHQAEQIEQECHHCAPGKPLLQNDLMICCRIP